MEQSDSYIKPVEYIVGEHLDKVYRGEGPPKSYTCQFIPIRLTLIKYLNCLQFIVGMFGFETSEPSRASRCRPPRQRSEKHLTNARSDLTFVTGIFHKNVKC